MKIRFINAVCILALILASACKSDNASQLKDKEMMITEKKNIGSKLALYPMPVTVVGAEVNGKVNWLLVAHVGIIGHDRILVSMSDKHYTNQGIIESKKLSVNLVDRKMLPKADYVGSVSGANTDKSHEFLFHWGENGSPVIDASPLVMECNVVDIYKSDGFDNFICSIANTYAAPEVLDGNGKLDYTRLKPVLFEFPTYSYIATGEIIGKCLNLDKQPGMCAKEPMTADGIVRLSKIEVYPQHLDEYMKYATEVGEVSLRTEPGVLTMYAVSEKENPCKVTILETYASREAYEKHIASEHFQKYKQGTLHMVKSLVLSDQTPLNPANRINNFIQSRNMNRIILISVFTVLTFNVMAQEKILQTAGRDQLVGFAPKFAELNDDVLFGEVWSRTDKLGLRDRSLVTITSLISQGITDNSLTYHLQSAKNNGITRTEIAEIITHIGFYAGWPKAWAAFRLAKEVWAEETTGEDAKAAFQRKMIFPIGEPNTAYAQYFTGNSYLAPVSREQVNISNVTFEPRCRNNWHIHKATKGGGQMLSGVAGHGWYQEEGKPAIEILPGTVIHIPANVKHWHGAAADSWFAHLAFEIAGENASNEWLEPVTDEEYDKLK